MVTSRSEILCSQTTGSNPASRSPQTRQKCFPPTESRRRLLSCWTPPPVTCQFGTVARVVERWVEWVGDLGWPPCVKSKVLTVGRATRATRIESFFVVRRGEDHQVASSGSQLLSLRDRCGEKGAPLGPHAWDQPSCLQLPAAA